MNVSSFMVSGMVCAFNKHAPNCYTDLQSGVSVGLGQVDVTEHFSHACDLAHLSPGQEAALKKRVTTANNQIV